MADEKLIQRARAAKSPEELLKLAEENGMADFTEEEAGEYFKILNRSGELSDSELENAAGGCKKGGKRVVTMGTVCSDLHMDGNGKYYTLSWKCKTCHNFEETCTCNRGTLNNIIVVDGGFVLDFGVCGVCGSCQWCAREKGLWVCTNPIANAI